MNQITVIFDGQCEFCQQSVTWIQHKLPITALPYQSSDLSLFNLTPEQCAKQVYVISDGITYGGANAIAFLLHQRGNKIQSVLIRASGTEPLVRVMVETQDADIAMSAAKSISQLIPAA